MGSIDDYLGVNSFLKSRKSDFQQNNLPFYSYFHVTSDIILILPHKKEPALSLHNTDSFKFNYCNFSKYHIKRYYNLFSYYFFNNLFDFFVA